MPKLQQAAGIPGPGAVQAERGDRVELLVISRWQSMDAIKAFAGPKPERAVVEPGAKAVLAEYDDVASHYEVTLEAPGAVTMTLEELASHIEAKLPGAIQRHADRPGRADAGRRARCRSFACSRTCGTIRTACSRC